MGDINLQIKEGKIRTAMQEIQTSVIPHKQITKE